MKTKLLILQSIILSLLLSLVGCSSDGNGNGGGIVCEYGTPSAAFKISGKVVSAEDNKPIKAIKVVMIAGENNNEGMVIHNSAVTSDANGEFLIKTSTFPLSKYIIKVEDVDGEENGLFNPSELLLTLKSNDFKNPSGAWFAGLVEKNVGTMKMSPKTETEE